MSKMKFAISENIKKFYPTPEECKVNNNVVCTEEGCSSVFISESNLNLHVAKTHKKLNLTSSDSFARQYFCPELGCAYNTDKYFKELKKLRMHFMMKHTPEQFVCLTCQKMFTLQKTLSRHAEYCGVDFICPVCQAVYPVYESLQTHGRRKQHPILNKIDYKLNKKGSKSVPIIELPTNRPILPKSSCSVIIFPSSGITKFSQESQTYNILPKYKSKMTQVCYELDQNNRQTQTGSINKYLTVETQTIGDYDYFPKKSNSIFNDLSQKNSNTQTDVVQSKHSSCNTSFNEEDFPMKDIETSSSSTQTGENVDTNNYSSSTHTHDSIYTDTSDLLRESLNANLSSFEFDNCHMETQTDFIFDDVMFGCDFMSNMYTQTCDQILTDLGFSNIQTQTAIDDMLKSVESQTVMSRKRPDVSDRDMMHMETQTDMEFREMLEVINS